MTIHQYAENCRTTPVHAYVLMCGWGPSEVQATAQHGVTADDQSALEAEGIDPEDLAAWCREQLAEQI